MQYTYDEIMGKPESSWFWIVTSWYEVLHGKLIKCDIPRIVVEKDEYYINDLGLGPYVMGAFDNKFQALLFASNTAIEKILLPINRQISDIRRRASNGKN